MFNLKSFIVTNIVNGVKNGTFTKEYGNIMAVNYYTKGIIGEEEIMEIDAQITEWENSQIVTEEPETVPEVEETKTETDVSETESSESESTEETSDEVETE